MTFTPNPLNLADSYKVGHHAMYPKGMTHLQSNFTPRTSRVEGVDKVVFFGLQAFLQSTLTDYFNEAFFKADPTEVIGDHVRRVEGLLGMPFDATHWYELHKLGYLPLEFKALPEGTEVPLRVPMFTIENTLPGYGWLVNYIESVLSNENWLPMTSATTALHFRRLLDRFAAETSDTPEFVDWQGHDFSFRGMTSISSGSASGAGHLLSFAGSDSLSAMDWAEQFYGGCPNFVGGSVPATEHSVMCAGGQETELETFRRLLAENPTGIISIVSDTWDYWKVLTETLPLLKDEILARDGKLVVRPDSGDPVKILVGDRQAPYGSPAYKGTVQVLWEVFGGTINSKGYRVLDSHIGVIYGDSITYDRAERILEGLKYEKFTSTTPVFGVGSFTYQYVTRDTFGFAMKATWALIDGVSTPLFKDPVTDNGTKKSAKGRLAVLPVTTELGERTMRLVNEASPAEEAASLLETVWKDGEFVKRHTFPEVTQRAGVRVLMPA